MNKTQRKRMLLHGGNALLVSIAVIGIAVVGYILVDRFRPFRLDMTKEGMYSLAPKTKDLLKSLDAEVKVTFFRVPAAEAQDAEFVNQKVTDLLEEYKVRSNGKLTFDIYSPYMDETKMVAMGADKGSAVFEAGEKKIVVQAKEIFTTSGSFEDEGPTSKFTGEEAFDSALLRLKSGKQEVACFLTGHGESGIDSNREDGFKFAAELLRQENLESKSVSLSSNIRTAPAPALDKTVSLDTKNEPTTLSLQEVPDDCSVLVIAGPSAPITDDEVASIMKFFDAGHGLVLLVEPLSDSKIENLASKLGVEVLPGLAMDPRREINSPLAIIPGYREHEIVLDMAAHQEPVILPRAQGLKPMESADLKLTSFLETSPAGRELVDIKGGKADPNDPKNVKGPLSLGIAVEKTIAGDTTKSARAVVIGSMSFAGNISLQKFGGGNVDLLKNSVHFAAGAQEKIGIAAKDPAINTVTITDRGALWVLLLTALVMPSTIFGSGVAVWLRRRSR